MELHKYIFTFFFHTVDKIKYVELCECFYYWDYRLVGFNNIATALKKRKIKHDLMRDINVINRKCCTFNSGVFLIFRL